MKENIKTANQTKSFEKRNIIEAIAFHIGTAVIAFILSRAEVLSKLLPLGIGFIGGCPLYLSPAAAVGCLIGYIFPANEGSGFRYIAALFAILAIKYLLGNYKKIISNPLFCALIVLLADLLTAAATINSGNTNFTDIFTESLICMLAAYFFSRFFKIVNRKYISFSTDELTIILVCTSLAIMGFSVFNIAGISFGRILAIFLITVSAKYGGILAGAVSGISSALFLALTGTNPYLAIALAFSGLACGVVAKHGKYAEIFATAVFSVIGATASNELSVLSSILIEVFAAALIFMFLPRNISVFISKVFSGAPKTEIGSNIKKSVKMQLEQASAALCDVGDTVSQVSKELAKINAPDFGTVINLIEDDACSGCKLRIHCWETKREATIEAILQMTKAVKCGENNPESFATSEFKVRCVKPGAVAEATYKRYSSFASLISAQNRISEVQSVVLDQFDGISEMLKELSHEFQNDGQFDTNSAQLTANALKDIGLSVEEAYAKIDKYGRMTVELKVQKQRNLVLNKMQIMKTASVACERDFAAPQITEVGSDIYILLFERPNLKIDIGVEQSNAFGSNICGDAYKYFLDGKGHFIMVLSDGMGTGGRAAVDGAMASGLMSRLIKAGFGYDCSLKILNSSMLFKSTDESLATVDIASIDLFSGKTELYKAGAAPSIIRRSGKTGKAQSTSLPAGILREISFDKAVLKCRKNDIVVLMSDGAVGGGTDWIRDEIESFNNGSAQSLAERICECAKRRRNDNHEDDITVMVAILN